MSRPSSGRGPLLFTVALALLGGGAVLAWGLVAALTGPSPIGDGRDPATYGVDLTGATMPAEAFAASGRPRDFLTPYVDPDTLPGVEVATWNAEHARKWQKEVVSTDRVVGVSIGDAHRAYPLFIVDAHEVVLDDLGGVPIVVTRSPLVDEAMAYERDSTDAWWGVSGLLGDLSLLMHDAGPSREETAADAEPVSLVSAHDGRAVAGPRGTRGDRLRPISGVSIVRWRDWLTRHPDTSVVVRDPASMQRYRRISYDRYLDGDAWILEPRATPPASLDLDPRARVLSVLDPETGDLLAVLPNAALRAAAVRDRVEMTVGDRRLVVQPDPALDAVLVVESDGLVTRPGMWIGAWLAEPAAAEAALGRGRAVLGAGE